MPVIASATVGNYNAEIRYEGAFRHLLMIDRCGGRRLRRHSRLLIA
jgi:hypothetical protein